MIRRIVEGDKAVFQSTKNLKTLKWKREGWGQVDDFGVICFSWVQCAHVLQWLDELAWAAFGRAGCGDVAQPARQ